MGLIKKSLKWLYRIIFYLSSMIIIVFIWNILGAEFQINDILLGFIFFIHGTITILITSYDGK